jgi:hypothetical protein
MDARDQWCEVHRAKHKKQYHLIDTLALFIWLIIRLIQLVFSAGTIFFSHKKSATSVFQPAYNSSRTAPLNTKLVKSHRNNKNSETRDHGIIQSRELTVNRKLCAQ